MGNVNCLANNTDEQELYNDQSPITPSKAALMLQNEFRREKGNLSFRRNIIELINKKLEEKKKILKPNMDVYVKSLQKEGITISYPSKNNEVQVQFGNIKMAINII